MIPDRAAILTLAEYEKLSPRTQGYVVYMQGERPGSELKDLHCPYPDGSRESMDWHQGQVSAVLEAQDADD